MLGTGEKEKGSPCPRHVGSEKELEGGKRKVGMGKEASVKAWPKRKMMVVALL